MDISTEMIWLIVGGTIVTAMPRIFPIVVLSKLNLPPLVLKWLEYIPISIMSALLAQEIIIPNDEFGYFSNNLRLIAAIPPILVAIYTRSLLGTVMIGMLTMMVLRFIF